MPTICISRSSIACQVSFTGLLLGGSPHITQQRRDRAARQSYFLQGREETSAEYCGRAQSSAALRVLARCLSQSMIPTSDSIGLTIQAPRLNTIALPASGVRTWLISSQNRSRDHAAAALYIACALSYPTQRNGETITISRRPWLRSWRGRVQRLAHAVAVGVMSSGLTPSTAFPSGSTFTVSVFAPS